MAHEFRYLFQPVRVGPLTLKNRIYSSAHGEGMADGGRPGPRLRAYHEAKARGGCAMTMVGGSTSVHPTSPYSGWNVIANHDDSIIPQYRALADAVHRHDCLVVTQLTHLGRRGRSDAGEWVPLVAPSAIPELSHREVPHELEPEQIATLVRAFGDAVRRCRDGGLDGVELSMASNHLVDQFWSPLFNQRSDAYGGSLENRMRFGFEVLTEIRRQVGSDFLVGARITGDEFTDGGLTLDDMTEIGRRLAAMGQLDFLSIVGAGAHTPRLVALAVPNMSFPPAPYVYLAAAIRRVVPGLPIFHASRIVDPVTADRLLEEGYLDVVGMTRALIADPDLPRKAREGRLTAIRYCVGANEGCIDRAIQGKATTCVQNPGAGREAELGDPTPTSSAKRVVVVGGGVGGLEAARVAALRGHRVVLFERELVLGGQVVVAARAPKRGDYAGIADFLQRQVADADVEVRLGTDVTVDMVLAEHPDVVITATGSRAYRPALPGANSPHVVTDRDVLLERVAIGQRVVLVDDVHTEAALSTAEFLLDRGCSVEIVSRLLYVGQDTGMTSLVLLYGRLFAKGVVMMPHSDLRAIEGSTVIVTNVHSGVEKRLEGVDTVVLSMGSRASDGLYRELKGRVPELYAVGDSVAPRGVHHAILEGSRAGRRI